MLLYVPRAGQRMRTRVSKTEKRLDRDVEKRQLFD